MSKEFRTFEVDLSQLSESERKVIEKLTKAAELIGGLYQKQENHDYPGANFYPHDVTKIEVEEAAQINPAILSPFTILERDHRGQLAWVPYHRKYQDELRPVAALMKEAARLTEDEPLAGYLRLRADALLTDEYEESERFWLAMPKSKIDFIVGPLERYIDKLFFVKRAYQASVQILDEEKTKQAEKIRDTLYSTSRSTFNHVIRVSPLGKGVKVRVDNSPIFAGLISKIMFTGEHLPSDLDVIEKYGSELVIYLSSINEKFTKLHYPIFERIFEDNFKRRYSKELLFRGSFWNILLHELSHQLHKYRSAHSRLRGLYPVFDEANAWVSGIRSCRPLVMKGVIEQKELEAVIVMHICRAFTDWLHAKKEAALADYARGYVMTLNFYIQEEALKQAQGISWPNFARIFSTIETLSDVYLRILTHDTYPEAERFLQKHCSTSSFEKFRDRLKDIPVDL